MGIKELKNNLKVLKKELEELEYAIECAEWKAMDKEEEIEQLKEKIKKAVK